MIAIDFLEILKTYIEDLSFTPSTIHIGLYNENNNSIAIRPMPSNIDDRYMEYGKVYPFQFQLLVHHRENLFAYSITEQLMSQLDNLSSGAITSSNRSFSLISFQCTNTPNFVQKTSYGVLWQTVFTAELYIGGNA
ncbi:hypothetical protein J2Z83_003731 [Virgibacillus natechei]|uniref:Minor capsid protein n=1 Tax=Virgibacillus natechei TaxID=1216297 RepID=A0ABS4IKZ7_9BACI|nr:hypothetical protein [Virgibacillus natechei]